MRERTHFHTPDSNQHILFKQEAKYVIYLPLFLALLYSIIVSPFPRSTQSSRNAPPEVRLSIEAFTWEGGKIQKSLFNKAGLWIGYVYNACKVFCANVAQKKMVSTGGLENEAFSPLSNFVAFLTSA